jgi:hypothetical protein
VPAFFFSVFWGVADDFISQLNTQTMHFESIILMFSKKTSTLAGFEPGSSVPEVDAMSTAPSNQGMRRCTYECMYFLFHRDKRVKNAFDFPNS